jgi:uncharacterized protein (TIGR03435 family)
MKKLVLYLVACMALAGVTVRAQDVTGTWQGTLKAQKDLRLILVVSKDDGKLKASMYSIDQGAVPELTEALQQQDGPKLSAEKTSVDVIAIDHVEKPSGN